MKNIIRLLTFGSFAILLLFAGCSQLLFDEDLQTCQEQLPVSIVAKISTKSNSQKAEQAITRADGNINEDAPGTWQEQVEAMLENERTIAHIFLFVYKKGSATPEKVHFYYPQGGSNPLASATNLLDMRPFTLNGGAISMNLELYSGFYNFVMIVNSQAALTTAKGGTIPTPAALTEDNTVLTSDDLTGSDRKYLPMVGQNELFVPNYVSGSDANRVKLNPAIDLERVHARVEFLLTTQKTEADGGDYLSPILPQSEVKSLTLLNEQKKYTVMPSADDYTVTGSGLTNPIRATALTASTPMTGRTSFHQGTAISDTDAKIAKFTKRRLPYDETTKVSKYIYVAPSTLATSAADCLTLDFVVAFPGQTTEADYTHYKIPLVNVDIKDTKDKKRYITRRNTIYRITAKLSGPDTIDLDYEIPDWEDVEVDIPW